MIGSFCSFFVVSRYPRVVREVCLLLFVWETHGEDVLVTRHLYVELKPTIVAGECRLLKFSWVLVG